MSEEWDEVVHEVNLMAQRLWAFRADILAAEKSGALTEFQCAFVKVVGARAQDTAERFERHMLNALERKAAKDGAKQ